MDVLNTIKTNGMMKRGDPDADDVKVVQQAIYDAGYRIGVDGHFGARTEEAVRLFQKQHGLVVDGKVGVRTATLLLKTPSSVLIDKATPLTTATPFNVQTPHDDTASLLAFYGDPRGDLDAWKVKNVVTVKCPWTLLYEGKPWNHPIPFHRKAAAGLKQALDTIWAAAQQDDASPLLKHVRHYSGSGNLRPIRNSTRISTHGFWAAIDFDAEHLPLAKAVPKSEMPEQIVNAFIGSGAAWGGNWTGRKDPMHFQYAHG